MSLQEEDETRIPDVKRNIGTSMQEEDIVNLKEKPTDDENNADEQIPDTVERHLVKNLAKESTSKVAWDADSSTRKKNMTEHAM